MPKPNFPAELTPLNLKAYFYTALGCCGCSEFDAMYESVMRLLAWHDADISTRMNYQEIYNDLGAFYLLAGLFDTLGLAEHGTSIRGAWLTGDGKRLLDALRKHPAETIDAACGEAYDGCHYGEC